MLFSVVFIILVQSEYPYRRICPPYILIFETWIQDELIVRIFGQEHLRLYIVWLCQIQSVLWHDIEVKRFLLTTLIDDEILYFVGFPTGFLPSLFCVISGL